MNVEPTIENINDFRDYNNKTHAQFHAAIKNLEYARDREIMKGDLRKAFELQKLKREFEKLFNKKLREAEIEALRSARKK